MTDNNTCMMKWNSPMNSKLLQNKFLILVAVSVHLKFWSFSRPTKTDLEAVVYTGSLSGSQWSLIHESALWANITKFDNSNFWIKFLNTKYDNFSHEQTARFKFFGCQPDEPLAPLVTTNRIINVYGCCYVTHLFCPSLLVFCWE